MEKRTVEYEHELITSCIHYNRDGTITFAFDLPARMDVKGLKELSQLRYQL